MKRATLLAQVAETIDATRAAPATEAADQVLAVVLDAVMEALHAEGCRLEPVAWRTGSDAGWGVSAGYKGAAQFLAACGVTLPAAQPSAEVREVPLIVRQLAQLRVAAGMSQGEMARRTGTRQSAVSELESGAVSPMLSTLARFASLFGATPVLMVGGGVAAGVGPRLMNLDL